MDNIFRYKLVIEYDGTEFYGWQIQPNQNTVQREISIALFKMTNKHIIPVGSGRTDKGVHAIGQVAHIDLDKFIKPQKLQEGLNHYLHASRIAIRYVELTDQQFHARFHAKRKIYQYLIWTGYARNVFLQNKAWHISQNIDLTKLQQTLNTFVGVHDFVGFRGRYCQAVDTIRSIDAIHVNDLSIMHSSDNAKHMCVNPITHKNIMMHSNQLIQILFIGRSFLQHQIRIMTGSAVQVVIGNNSTSLQDMLLSQDRTQAGITAPAHGLYLHNVVYE